MSKFSCAICGAIEFAKTAVECWFEYEGFKSSGTCCAECAGSEEIETKAFSEWATY